LPRRIDVTLQPSADETSETEGDHGGFQIDLGGDALGHMRGLLGEIHQQAPGADLGAHIKELRDHTIHKIAVFDDWLSIQAFGRYQLTLLNFR